MLQSYPELQIEFCGDENEYPPTAVSVAADAQKLSAIYSKFMRNECLREHLR